MGEATPIITEQYPPSINTPPQMYANSQHQEPPTSTETIETKPLRTQHTNAEFVSRSNPTEQRQQSEANIFVFHPNQGLNLGKNECTITCPACMKNVVSRVNHETATKTHIMAGLLILVGCCLCAWIPYVMDSCKNINHYCPNCGAFVGTHIA